MKCERLTLVNFCKLRHKVIEFGDGMTGIIGPNGSGKSSIFGALSFALTGVNPNFGVKTANICDLAPETESSYTELVFSHGAIRAVVRRNIRPAKPTATLNINDGAEVIEGDMDVTARIQQILGMPTDILNDIVIVGQEEIFGFISKTPAKRAEQFQRLFGTEHAAVLHKLIGDHLKTVEIPAVGVDRDQLLTQLRTCENELYTAQQVLAQYATHEEIQNFRDQNSAVVIAYQQLQRLENDLAGAKNQQLQLYAAKEQAQANVQRLEIEKLTVTSSLSQVAPTAEQARLTLANLTAAKQRAAARLNNTSRLQHLQTQLTAARDRPPVPVPGYITDMAPAEHALRELNLQCSTASSLLKSFQCGVAECPTCHTPATTLAAKIDEARLLLPQYEQQRDQLQQRIQQSREYDRQKAAYDSAVAALEQQINTLDAQLREMPSETLETVDETATKQIIDTHKTLLEGVAEYDQLISRANADVARWDGQLTAVNAQIVKYEHDLASSPRYTAEQAQQAQQNVTQWDVTARDRRQLESQVTGKGMEATKLRDQIAAADRVLTQATILRGWHQFAETVRGVFHKDAAPRFVSQRNLEHLQASINESLNRFGAEYRVTADEGLSFQCRFVDGSVQPAERISVGQRVVLALSFRLALNLMCAENIGALYLDEPTAWLDEATIKGFEPVLMQLRDFSAARGLQSIIITHERALAPLFDTVVQL